MKLKTIICLLFFGLLCNSIYAQVMEDDFEDNQSGWSETSGPRGIALVKEGVLHMEAKGLNPLTSTTYAPIDIDKPFVMTVEALANAVNNVGIFGILLDYEDDSNYILFYLNEGDAKLEVVREDKVIGKKFETLKLKSGRKVGIDFEIEYTLNELVFKVNGIKAMTYRRRLAKGEFLLGTSGIGFFAKGGQKIDFDNLSIMQ